MQQVTELLKAAGEFLAGLGAVIAPIATVVIAPPPEARTAQAATEAAQAVRKGPSEYPNYPEGPAPILSHGTS